MSANLPKRLALFHGWTRLVCSFRYLWLAIGVLLRHGGEADLTHRVALVARRVKIEGYGRLMTKVYAYQKNLGTDQSDHLLEYYLGQILLLQLKQGA